MRLNQNLQKAKDLFREKKIKHEINFKKCIQEPNKFKWKYFMYYASPVPPTAKKRVSSTLWEKKWPLLGMAHRPGEPRNIFRLFLCSSNDLSISIFFGERHQIKSQEFPHQLCMDLILSLCCGQTNLFYEITETLVCIQPSYLNKI